MTAPAQPVPRDPDEATAAPVAGPGGSGHGTAARDAGEFRSTPNAERYILAADALRRRQLETAMVHGSDRTWRERRRIWPAATGGIITVLVIAMVVAAVGAFHRQQELQRAKERQRAAERAAGAVAGFPVRAYRGHGLIANVPADWRRRETERGIRLTDKKEQRWLRIEVIPDNRPARQILQEADARLSQGCCGLRYYKWLGIRSAKLGKHRGAEMSYTGLDEHRLRRQLTLRVVSVGGHSYRVTMSVPHQRQNQSQPILDEIARSFKIDR